MFILCLLLSWHKDAKTIHSSCRWSVRFCPDGERTSEAMNPAPEMLLRSISASFEDTEFSLCRGSRVRWVQVWGYHFNRRIIPNHTGEPALFCLCFTLLLALTCCQEGQQLCGRGTQLQAQFQASCSLSSPSEQDGMQTDSVPGLLPGSPVSLAGRPRGGSNFSQLMHSLKNKKIHSSLGWGEMRARASWLYLTGTSPVEGGKKWHVQGERLFVR